MPKVIAAISDAFRIAEYDTRFKSHPPFEPPPGHEKEGHLLDKYAKPVRDRWLYPIVSRYADDGNVHIPFEARINEDGIVMRPDVDISPDLPIPARPDIFFFDPDHPESLALADKLDEQGRAQMVRLFLSPFRLTQTAVKTLCSRDFRKARNTQIPSLWEWETTGPSVLTSADGYHFKERRTFCTVPGSGAQRVWMAVDPFRIARRRSDRYVAARKAYAQGFEARTATDRAKWEQQHFLELLNDTVQENPGVPDEYKKALNYSSVESDYEEYSSQKVRAQLRVADRVQELIDVFDSPFFAIMTYSAMEGEGVPADADNSEALTELIETIAVVMRNLDECKEGLALVHRWIASAKFDEKHFINQIVLPPRAMTLHAFKTARWTSKGLFSLVTVVYSKAIPILEKSADDIARALHRIGVFETAQQGLDFLATKSLSLDKISTGLRTGKARNRFQEVKLFTAAAATRFEAYLKLDKSGGIPWFKSPPVIKAGAFLVLDLVNIGFAYSAVVKAEGPENVKKAVAGFVGAGAFLAVSIVETTLLVAVDRGWAANPSSKLLKRVFRGAQAAGALIYGAIDIVNAFDALKKKDTNTAVALFVASAAEIVSASIYITQILLGAPVLGGFLGVTAAVAMAAYAVAVWSKDDPLEKFLENCAYGRTPFAEKKYAQKWSEGAVSSWKGDYRKQTRIFIRLLTRFSLHWDRAPGDPNPLRVNVDCYRRTMDTRITITYVAEFAGRSNTTDDFVFEHDTLPRGAKPLAVSPPEDYVANGAHTVTVHASIHLLHEGYDHSTSAFLFRSGSWVNSERVGSVD